MKNDQRTSQFTSEIDSTLSALLTASTNIKHKCTASGETYFLLVSNSPLGIESINLQLLAYEDRLEAVAISALKRSIPVKGSL